MRHFFVCAILILLSSCREDFSLEADFQDIPVVFAYLNPTDDVQYARVQRVIQGGGGDAGAAAADADRLYYPEDVTVRAINERTLEATELERVDGRVLGLEREDGVFAGDPNVLYRFPTAEISLRPGDGVALEVERSENVVARAETTLLEPLEIIRPSAQVRLDDYRRPQLIAWRAGGNAAVFSIQFVFNIREFYSADPARDRTLRVVYTLEEGFRPGEGERSGDQLRYEVNNEDVYRFLGRALPQDDGVVRRLDDFAVQITAAGTEVARLLDLENANAGLTSSQSIPRYTNVVGGQGIYTSRTSEDLDGIRFDDGSLDSLREGQYTRQLNFQ
jgi:hypothetical protein